MQQHIQSILDFWFGSIKDGFSLEAKQALWFQFNSEIDKEIASRFGAEVLAAGGGQLDAWQQSARGRLALILLLDQFPRNIYRGSSKAFSFDQQALQLAKQGIENGQHRELATVERCFFYMPFEHSENLADQNQSVALFRMLLDEVPDEHKAKVASSLKWAEEHCEIIKQFGRFPHRNKVLGRASTEEERLWLEKGTTFGQ